MILLFFSPLTKFTGFLLKSKAKTAGEQVNDNVEQTAVQGPRRQVGSRYKTGFGRRGWTRIFGLNSML